MRTSVAWEGIWGGRGILVRSSERGGETGGKSRNLEIGGKLDVTAHRMERS